MMQQLFTKFKSSFFCQVNYFDTLYELLEDTVHWNIAQDNLNSLGRDKTCSGLLWMKAEVVSLLPRNLNLNSFKQLFFLFSLWHLVRYLLLAALKTYRIKKDIKQLRK